MWAGGEVLTGEAEKGKMPAGEVEMNDFLTEEFPNFHRHLGLKSFQISEAER